MKKVNFSSNFFYILRHLIVLDNALVDRQHCSFDVLVHLIQVLHVITATGNAIQGVKLTSDNSQRIRKSMEELEQLAKEVEDMWRLIMG